MEKRRQFLKKSLNLLAGVTVFLSPLYSLLQRAFAQVEKIILPKGTPRETLIDKHPANLDTRNLEVTALENFGTMGLSDHAERLDQWCLEVTGLVGKPLSLKYDDVLAMPSVERNVLLICPGFFANHGTWKGVSIRRLIERAEAGEDATHVTLYGPKGTHENTQRFPIKDVRSEAVFVAYQVNGKALPQRHGFPLRVVAEGYYGYDWVKYVYRITVEKV
jgi:sulfoxide reductase catalytic subunit YedY